MSYNIMVLAHRVPYPPNKGDKLRTYYQLRHLVDQGCNITVCTPLSDTSDESHLLALSENLGVATIGLRHRFRYIRLLFGAVTAKPLSVSNFYLKSLQKALDARLDQDSVDVVMCTSSCMAEYIFNSQKLSESLDESPLFIMDFMDLDSDKWQQYAEMRGWPGSLIYAREARLLLSYECKIHDMFDHCLFVSTQEVAMFESALGHSSSKLHAVGNGVDPECFYPAQTSAGSGATNLVFVGVMDYFPNEDAMLWFVNEMWPALRKLWPETTLSIVGMRPSEKIASLRSVEGVEVVGFVDDVLPWFHNATVFVAPFRVARGVQNKILQAFATGVPVVTTSLGAEGIPCTDGIELLIADDKDKFVEQVNRLVGSPDLRISIRARALSLVNNEYSWKSQNDQLYDLFKEM